MLKTEKEMLENYKARIKRQNNKIKEDYDRVSATLPKGTINRIKSLGLTINGVINESVLAYLECMENEQNEPPEPPKQESERFDEEANRRKLLQIQVEIDKKRAEQAKQAAELQAQKEERERLEKEANTAELLRYVERIRSGEQMPEDAEKEQMRQESIIKAGLPY